MINQFQKVDLDTVLDNVSYKELEKYKPSFETLLFFNFVRMVNKDNPDFNDIPPMHFKMIDDILNGFGKTEPKNCNYLNMFHRGAGKTTVGAELLIFYLAALGTVDLGIEIDLGIIFVGDSVDNGVRSLTKNMKTRYENSELLRRLIPEANILQNEVDFKDLNGRRTSVKLYGAKSGIRGVRINNMRPHIAIIDDVLSDDDARSDTVISSIRDTVFKAVEHALTPDRKWRRIVWNGTPFNKKDPLYTTAESGAYVLNVYPICTKFPCSKEEFEGSWEDRFNYEYVKNSWATAVATGTENAFYQELMLRITNEEDRIISLSDIKWYDRHTILNNPTDYYFFITTDIAVSSKNSADYTAVGVWAVDSKQNRYLIDGFCKRQSVTETMHDLFRYNKIYSPQSIGLERSGQQQGIIDLIDNEGINRNEILPIGTGKNTSERGIQPTVDKISRFTNTSHWFKRGKIYFPNEIRASSFIQEVLEELKFTTYDGIKSKHDDCIDMLSQFDQMRIYYPSQSGVGNKLNDIDNKLYNSGHTYNRLWKMVEHAENNADNTSESLYDRYLC